MSIKSKTFKVGQAIKKKAILSVDMAACVMSNKCHTVSHPVTPNWSMSINLSDPAGPESTTTAVAQVGMLSEAFSR